MRAIVITRPGGPEELTWATCQIRVPGPVMSCWTSQPAGSTGRTSCSAGATILSSVTASYRLVAYGTIPLGAMTGGMLTSRFGPGLTLFIIAASMTISSTTLIASPLRHIQTVEQSRRLVAVPAAHDVSPHL